MCYTRSHCLSQGLQPLVRFVVVPLQATLELRHERGQRAGAIFTHPYSQVAEGAVQPVSCGKFSAMLMRTNGLVD